MRCCCIMPFRMHIARIASLANHHALVSEQFGCEIASHVVLLFLEVPFDALHHLLHWQTRQLGPILVCRLFKYHVICQNLVSQQRNNSPEHFSKRWHQARSAPASAAIAGSGLLLSTMPSTAAAPDRSTARLSG